jgi:hypothetical protein
VPLAWSYARTSTTLQAGADRSGMERQEAALTRWLADHPDYQLAEALVDAGISAGKGRHRKRGALSRFIEGGRSGTVPPGSCLVVESMSRFSREAERAALETLLRDIWGQGMAIAFAEGDGAVLSGELIDREPHRIYSLLGGISQARAEWLERSRRSKGAAVKARRAQDEGCQTDGTTPWWILRDASTGRLVRDADGSLQLDPVSAATIRRAVELAIDGLGSTHVADRLTAEARPAPWRRSGRQPGEAWTHSQVAYLLRQHSIAGTLERKGRELVPGYYPPVITLEQWAQLRAGMEQRHRAKGRLRPASPRVRNLFQGLARCAQCGGPMTFAPPSGKARAGHPGFVICRQGIRRGGACTHKGYIPYDQFEAHLLTRLSTTDWAGFLRQPEGDADRHQIEQEADRARAERDQLQAQLANAQERAQKAWADGATEGRVATIEGAVAALRAQLAAAEGRRTETEQRLAVARSRVSADDAAAELHGRVKEFWSHLATATPTERLDFNRWLLSRQPAIEFRLGPKPTSGGDRLVSLLLDGRRVGYAPLAGPARQWAREQGMVDPTLAIAEQLPDGRTALVLIERTPWPPPPPRGQLELIDGGQILVLNPSCPAADAEPPDEWPWSALLVPGLGSDGGAAAAGATGG